MSNYSQKQIANWRRVRQNIESDLTKLTKIEEKLEAVKIECETKVNALRDKYAEKINEIQLEAEYIRNLIDVQEQRVKMDTNGHTSQEIFVKEWVVSDKVDANGKASRKAVYNLRYPDTIIPPETTEGVDAMAPAQSDDAGCEAPVEESEAPVAEGTETGYTDNTEM